MEQYIRSFKVISSFNDGRMVKKQDQVEDFTHLLEILLDDHGSVIDDLTQVHFQLPNFPTVIYRDSRRATITCWKFLTATKAKRTN